MKEHRDEFLLQGVLGDELDRLLAHPLDLLVEPLDRVVGVDLPPKRLREFAEGEEVAQGIGPFGDGFAFGPHFPLNSANAPSASSLLAFLDRDMKSEAASFLSEGRTLEQRFLIR